MPYDYAWNLLSCADENAVLFTNGDNDTFPLWCLQGVYGVRTDVTIVNLALANTKWYIKQIQSSLGLDLGWSEQHIDNMMPFRIPDSATLAQRGQYVDKQVYAYLGVSDREMDSLYRLRVPYGATLRLNDMVKDKIIYSYRGKRPINYAVSIGGGPRRYLGQVIDSMVSLSGMMWRLNTTAGLPRTDVDGSIEFFTGENGFRARGVNDPTVYKNDASRRLTNNYANGFLVVADTLRVKGDLQRAQRLIERAVELIPHSSDAVEFLAALYSEQGMTEPLTTLIATSQTGDKLWLQTLLARAYRAKGLDIDSENILSTVLAGNPKYRPAFEELIRFYFETNRVGEMKTLLQTWLQTNPNDQRVRAMVAELQKGLGRHGFAPRDSQ
jgi:tetratricopeptide (TPR) repeat protein